MTIKYEYIHCGDIHTKYVEGVNKVDCSLAFRASTMYDAVLSVTICR